MFSLFSGEPANIYAIAEKSMPLCLPSALPLLQLVTPGPHNEVGRPQGAMRSPHLPGWPFDIIHYDADKCRGEGFQHTRRPGSIVCYRQCQYSDTCYWNCSGDALEYRHTSCSSKGKPINVLLSCVYIALLEYGISTEEVVQLGWFDNPRY